LEQILQFFFGAYNPTSIPSPAFINTYITADIPVTIQSNNTGSTINVNFPNRQLTFVHVAVPRGGNSLIVVETSTSSFIKPYIMQDSYPSPVQFQNWYTQDFITTNDVPPTIHSSSVLASSEWVTSPLGTVLRVGFYNNEASATGTVTIHFPFLLNAGLLTDDIRAPITTFPQTFTFVSFLSFYPILESSIETDNGADITGVSAFIRRTEYPSRFSYIDWTQHESRPNLWIAYVQLNNTYYFGLYNYGQSVLTYTLVLNPTDVNPSVLKTVLLILFSICIGVFALFSIVLAFLLRSRTIQMAKLMSESGDYTALENKE